MQLDRQVIHAGKGFPFMKIYSDSNELEFDLSKIKNDNHFQFGDDGRRELTNEEVEDYALNGVHDEWLESLEQRAHKMKGRRVGRRVFYESYSGAFIEEIHNPFSYEDFAVKEYLSEAHYLQVQQQQHEVKLHEEQIAVRRTLVEDTNEYLRMIEDRLDYYSSDLPKLLDRIADRLADLRR